MPTLTALTRARHRTLRFLAGENPLGRIFIGMSRADARRWAAATTHRQLGEVTALWLEGKVESQPDYPPYVGPDPETDQLIATLAAVNRAGYVTDSSQPGADEPGVEPREQPETCPGHRALDLAAGQQRAGVEGWADHETTERLRDLAEKYGLVFIAQKPGDTWDRGPGRVVSRTVLIEPGDVDWPDGYYEPCTWFGTTQARDDVWRRFEALNPDMVITLLHRGWSVTILDERWGPSVALWTMLTEFAAGGPR